MHRRGAIQGGRVEEADPCGLMRGGRPKGVVRKGRIRVVLSKEVDPRDPIQGGRAEGSDASGLIRGGQFVWAGGLGMG